MDGTLLDPGGRIVPDTLRAVEHVRAAGWLPVLLTGRSRWVAVAIGRTLGIADVICELGAVLVVDGQAHAAIPGALPVPREALVRALAALPAEQHEPDAPRMAGVVLRSAAPAEALTAALASAGLNGWQAVDNGPSHRPLADGRAARVVHLLPTGVDKTAGLRRHLAHRGLDAAAAGVVGDSPADVACADAVPATVVVRSADAQALRAADARGLRVTDAPGATGALEAVRALTASRAAVTAAG
nr:HAD hydrolase family protein [Patulibacter sp. SYSU D01012]